jgi:hypothetical protein
VNEFSHAQSRAQGIVDGLVKALAMHPNRMDLAKKALVTSMEIAIRDMSEPVSLYFAGYINGLLISNPTITFVCEPFAYIPPPSPDLN